MQLILTVYPSSNIVIYKTTSLLSTSHTALPKENGKKKNPDCDVSSCSVNNVSRWGNSGTEEREERVKNWMLEPSWTLGKDFDCRENCFKQIGKSRHERMLIWTRILLHTTNRPSLSLLILNTRKVSRQTWIILGIQLYYLSNMLDSDPLWSFSVSVYWSSFSNCSHCRPRLLWNYSKY